MKPEEQRIAIAEACGWHGIDNKSALGLMGMFGPLRGFMKVPDYLNDLNAMHEAEKMLTNEQCEQYQGILSFDPPDKTYPAEGWQFHITAAQRAEAFLRTLNLWKEETP